VGSYLQINQRVGVTRLSLSSLNLTGTGQLDSSGDTQILGVIATASVTLTSINPASISDSNLNSINNIGNTNQSILQAKTALIFGEGVVVRDSTILKNHTLDSTDQAMTKFSGTLLTFLSVAFDLNCPIHYSTSTTTTIKIVECSSVDNWVGAVSNGYSAIDWQNSIPVQNTSFTYMNGCSLLRTVSLNSTLSPCIGSSEPITHWRGALGSSMQSGTQITIAADTVIDAAYTSVNTIRFFGTILNCPNYGAQANAVLPLVKKYGGIVVAQFDYPNASNQGFCPVVHVVQPFYHYATGYPIYWNVNVDSALSNGYGYSPNNGSVRVQANAWVGQMDLNPGGSMGAVHWTDPWGDSDLSYPNAASALVNNIMIVITNTGTGNLPAGTKITLTIFPNMPDGIANYRAFFPLPVFATYNGNQWIDGTAILTHAQIYRNCDFAGLQVANSLNSNTPGAIPVTG
jgi:hypothetical protein